MTDEMFKMQYPFQWEEKERLINKELIEGSKPDMSKLENRMPEYFKPENRTSKDDPLNPFYGKEFILPYPDNLEMKLTYLERRVEDLEKEREVSESSFILKPTDEQIKLFGG